MTLSSKELLPYYDALGKAQQAGDTHAANQFTNFIKEQVAGQEYAKSGISGKEVGQQGKVERFLGGVKHAWDRGALGLKGLFTELTPEDKKLLAAGKQYVKGAGTAGTLGEIAGDTAILAPAGLGVSRGIMGAARGIANVAPRAPVVAPVARFVGGVPGKSSTLAADVASSAATAAALTPEERGAAAQGGAIGGALGNIAGKGIGLISGQLRGTITPEAQALMNQGIQVPAWKATSSTAIRNMAESAKGMPFMKSAMLADELRAFGQLNENIAKKSTPPTFTPGAGGGSWSVAPLTNKSGPKAVNEISERFNQAYKDVYGTQQIKPDVTFVNEVKKVVQDTGDYFPAVSAEFNGALKQVGDILTAGSKESKATGQFAQFGRPATPDAVQQALRTLDDRIKGAYGRGNAELAEQLETLRGSIADLRSRNIPKGNEAAFAEINKAYTSFKPYQRASGTLGAAKQEFVSPQQLASALRAGDKTPDKAAYARGNLPNQAEIMRAQRVLGSELPEVGPGTAEKLIFSQGLRSAGALAGLGYGGYDQDLTGLGGIAAGVGAGLALTTPTGQRFLLGQLPGQKALGRVADADVSSALLRSYLTGQNIRNQGER